MAAAGRALRSAARTGRAARLAGHHYTAGMPARGDGSPEVRTGDDEAGRNAPVRQRYGDRGGNPRRRTERGLARGVRRAPAALPEDAGHAHDRPAVLLL